jgi:hypothetical protein
MIGVGIGWLKKDQGIRRAWIDHDIDEKGVDDP